MKKKINVYAEITPNPDVMKFVTSELITKHDIEISKLKNNKQFPLANELLIFPFVQKIKDKNAKSHCYLWWSRWTWINPSEAF